MTRSPVSPSNLHRRAGCPGSRAMEDGLPDVRTGDGSEGTMLHEMEANPNLDRSQLEPEQVETLERNEAMQTEFIQFVEQEHKLDAAKKLEVREMEWWFERDGKRLFAMHPDRAIAWMDGVGVILDSKFGRTAVPAADVNWQLAAYACGMAQTFPYVKTVYVAITQPRLSQKIASAVYTEKDLKVAEAKIMAVLRASEEKDAPRRPSLDHCRYCRGFML